MNTTIEELDRQVRESQSLAYAKRKHAERMRRERRFWRLMWAMILLTGAIGLATVWTQNASARPTSWNTSTASVYDGQGIGGRVACLGYWPGGYAVAHRRLPCGTRVRFLYRGRKVTARVWDRGPFIAGRTFDLDVAVQRRLGFPFGVAQVKWRIVR